MVKKNSGKNHVDIVKSINNDGHPANRDVTFRKARSGRTIAKGLPNRHGRSRVSPIGQIKRPKKRLTFGRILGTLGALILSLVIIVSIGAYVYWNYVFSDFNPDPTNGGTLFPTQALTHQAPEMDEITNILLIGTDSRNPDQDYGLSDSLIILTVDSKANVIKMTSILRDSYTYIPGQDKPGKINTAYALGGPELALLTINNTFRMNIKYYISVNMESMEEIINIAGGVILTLTSGEANILKQYFTGGERISGTDQYLLNGMQAVHFARIRQIGSDFDRTRRQRDVLTALFRMFKETGVVTKTQMIQRGLSQIKSNMTAKQITSLGIDVLPKMSNDIAQLRLPLEGYYKVNSSGEWYMVVDYNRLIPELYKFIFGQEHPFDPVPTIKYVAASNTPTQIPATPTMTPEITATPTVDPEITPTVTPEITSTPTPDPATPTLTPEATPTVTP